MHGLGLSRVVRKQHSLICHYTANAIQYHAASDARLLCKNKQENMKDKPKRGNLIEKQAQHALAGKCNKTKNQQAIK